MILTFNYDRSYDPSAPVIEIGMGPSDGTPARITVRAFIDTGSDASMFPHGSQTIPGIQAAASPDSTEILLGRDVLNHLMTTLDGPGMSVEIRI